jgi:hypothetical protein
MHRFGIAIFLGAAAAAGAYGYHQHHATDAGSIDTQTLWLCKACDRSCQLTSEQVYADIRGSEGPAPPLECPSCHVRELFRALVCKRCHSAYFGLSVPGSNGKCHACCRPGDAPNVLGSELPAAPQNDNRDNRHEGKVKKESVVQVI